METDTLSKLRHSFRNHLNNIAINAELIKLVLEQDKPKDMALTSIEKILDEIKLCADSINQSEVD